MPGAGTIWWDKPYVPGNEDYEYDKVRQRKVDEEMDFGKLAIDALRDHAALTQAGMEIGRKHADMELRSAIKTILRAYDAAGRPAIPTAMLAALEAARKVVE